MDYKNVDNGKFWAVFIFYKGSFFLSSARDRHTKLYQFFFVFALLQDLQNKGFLEVINKYLEVHATVGGGVSKNLNFVALRLMCDTLSAG